MQQRPSYWLLVLTPRLTTFEKRRSKKCLGPVNTPPKSGRTGSAAMLLRSKVGNECRMWMSLTTSDFPGQTKKHYHNQDSFDSSAGDNPHISAYQYQPDRDYICQAKKYHHHPDNIDSSAGNSPGPRVWAYQCHCYQRPDTFNTSTARLSPTHWAPGTWA